MEREILIEALGNKRFKVELKDANKATLSRSYANATDCCGVKVKQEKFCSACRKKVVSSIDNSETETECSRKIVKIGKTEHLINAEKLDNAIEQLEQMDSICLTAFLSHKPEGIEDRYDAMVYVAPADKKASDYKELQEILKGRIAVGKGVFRSNEYQILMEVGADGIVRIRKLVEESRRYAFDAVKVANELAIVSVNQQVVDIEKQILDRKAIASYDFSRFKDARAVVEEQVIEDCVLNGNEAPIVPKNIVKEQKESDELARLQALLG